MQHNLTRAAWFVCVGQGIGMKQREKFMAESAPSNLLASATGGILSAQ